MKQVLLLFSLMVFTVLAFGQAKSASSAQTTAVVYNNSQSKTSPDLASFPIDRPFTLEIDNIQTNNITHIWVYEIETHNGIRKIHDRVDKFNLVKGHYRPSFEINPQGIFVGSNTIILPFPALKAEKEFDISIIKKFSPANLKRALTLNMLLDSQYYKTSVSKANPNDVISYNKKIDSLLTDLIDSVSNNKKYSNQNNYLVARKNGEEYKPNGQVIPIDYHDITAYKQYFYEPVKSDYQKLVSADSKSVTDKDTTTWKGFFWSSSWLVQSDINSIAPHLPSNLPLSNQLYILQKIEDDTTLFKKILLGKQPIDFTATATPTDLYDFSGRITNITGALTFFDTINDALINLKANGGGTTYDKLIKRIGFYIAELKHNSKFLSDHSKSISSTTLLNSTENIWVTGQSDKSPDMGTLSTRIFAVNAGVTNIFANDNSGKLNYIVKPFFGMDFHFKAYDKNADFNQIAQVPDESSSLNHSLEVRNSIWYRCSFTFGLAFGSMTNKDFNNAYGSFSFMAGPSYLVFKYLKVSAGIAAISRVNNNPLLASGSSWLYCPYVSLSFDYDLLGAVQNVTSSIFK